MFKSAVHAASRSCLRQGSIWSWSEAAPIGWSMGGQTQQQLLWQSYATARDEDTIDFGFQRVSKQDKQNLVAEVFSKVASSYDIMNDLMSGGMHRLWKDQLVATLRPFPGMKHLDVAGGTGDVAFRILRAIRAAEAQQQRSKGASLSGQHRPTAADVRHVRAGSSTITGVGSSVQAPGPGASTGATTASVTTTAQGLPGVPGTQTATATDGSASASAGTGVSGEGPGATGPGAGAGVAARAGTAAARAGAGAAGVGTGQGQQDTGAASTPGAVWVCDINPDMLAEGRRKASVMSDLAGDNGLVFELGNAEALTQFPDNTFDAYTIAFGIRNVTDREAALREAHRVLKPGGRLLCMEFSQVSIPLLKQAYDTYSFTVIPRLGELVAGERASYQYLVESIRQFPDQNTWASMIEAAGFQGVGYENIMGGVVALHSGYKL